jgi:DNA polymerase elongation subunit (family B)
MKHTARQIVLQTALKPGDQYVNVTTINNHVYARARDAQGAPIYVKQKYEPDYFTEVDPLRMPPTHTAFDGTPLVRKHFKSLYDAKTWQESSHASVYGDIQPEYMMLADVYGANDVEFTMERLYIWNIDIEVDSEHGFAKPDDPFAEVTAITVQWRHMGASGIVVYGRKPYTVQGDELYIQNDTEEELILRFLDDFRSAGDYPDIITGWNVQFYDVPYLVKRLERLFTEETCNRISPFSRVSSRNLLLLGRSQTVTDLKGVAIIDYLEAYRKFTYSQQESYRLDHIAHVELGKRKVSYAEYQSLRRLYRENHQKFIEYNIRDVTLVDELDQKLKLIELIAALAYGAKANFADCFKQVRLWDIMIYHKLRAEGKQIPPRVEGTKTSQYPGAYVKDTKPGLYPWVVSFDVASMYPHIIREWNLSPEAKLSEIVIALSTRDKSDAEITAVVDRLLAREFDTSALVNRDLACAGNGVLTSRGREGFLPSMLKTLYEERIKFKKLQKGAEKDKEHETDPAKRAELVKKIAAFENQQKVRKVNLNSAYGAMGSAYFRFFDVDLASAVTVTGQMVIRWVARDLNAYLNRQFNTKTDYIIASDTDSVYVDVERVVAAIAEVRDATKPGFAVLRACAPTKVEIVNALNAFCEQRLQPIINAAFEDIAKYLNVALPCMTMVRDVIADNCIWRAPKNYAMHVYDSEGVRYDKPKLKVMGLEIVRSSTPQIARDMMKKALTLLVEGGSQQDMWAYLAECEAKFCAAPFEDVAKPSSVNGLTKYAEGDKHVPIHVTGALVFNRLITMLNDQSFEPIREGEKIKCVYLRQPNPFRSHVIAAAYGCPPAWEIEKWIDYRMQYDKTFLQPLRGILECAGWTTEPQPSLF